MKSLRIIPFIFIVCIQHASIFCMQNDPSFHKKNSYFLPTGGWEENDRLECAKNAAEQAYQINPQLTVTVFNFSPATLIAQTDAWKCELFPNDKSKELPYNQESRITIKIKDKELSFSVKDLPSLCGNKKKTCIVSKAPDSDIFLLHCNNESFLPFEDRGFVTTDSPITPPHAQEADASNIQ